MPNTTNTTTANINTFAGLNVPTPISIEYGDWMLNRCSSCAIAEKDAICEGRGCSGCIYSIRNAEARGLFFQESFPEQTYSGLIVPIKPRQEFAQFCTNADAFCKIHELMNRTDPEYPKLRKYCDSVSCDMCIYARQHSSLRRKFFLSKMEGYWECPVCHETQAPSCGKETVHGIEICRSCANRSDLYFCAGCGTVHAASWEGMYDVMHENCSIDKRCYRGVKQLGDAYFLCNDCGKAYHNRFMSEELFLCESCFSRYTPCVLCGTRTRHEYCDDCEILTREEIHCYSFKPKTLFNKCKGEEPKYFFGVEWEIGDAMEEDRDWAVDHVCCDEFFKQYYLKSDSSIPSYGFELVTHPCSYEYHMKEFPWESLCETAEDAGLSGGRGRGIHIHISRSALTEFQWLLFDYFINTNREYWMHHSNRKSNHYCQYTTGKIRNHLYMHYGVKTMHYGDRYRAVNFQNPNTVEVRTFCSRTNPNTIKKYIVLCESLVRFIAEGRYTPSLLAQKGKERLLMEFETFFIRMKLERNLG